MSNCILVVDDDDAHRGMLRTMLRSWGYAVEEAADGDEAVSLVREKSFDAVLTDVRMARMDGIHALRNILEYNPALPVVLMTAYSSVETAVEALRLGAYDYLVKPLDFEALRHTLEKAIEHSRLSVENRELRRQLGDAAARPGILGRSAPIRAMQEIIATVAPTEATVLISGESGTGKELVARALHSASARAEKPLVTVNCAALAENLLESELFGHEKGSFTGADRRREGRFAQANGGTLFLDEIGEMPLSLQAKLLRALQQGEVQRVGADAAITVDVRVLAATNRDLREEVAQKRFREDLYFRLNVICIEVPPLRDRADDIPVLAAHFLERFASRNRKSVRGFSPQALASMLRYAWPGNVRELENLIEGMVIAGDTDRIDAADLPAAMRVKECQLPLIPGQSPPADAPSPSPAAPDTVAPGPHDAPDWDRPFKDVVAGFEQAYLTQAIAHFGSLGAAARHLGLDRTTVFRKLKRPTNT